MSQLQTIALDAMGGDYGPGAIVPAAAAALKEMDGARFLFFGHQDKITRELDKCPDLKAVSEIHHTDKVIGSDDKPSAALRGGKESSMRLALDAVKDGRADCMVSAGNTGALMAMSKMVLKCLPGITRPAIASVMPTMKGQSVMLDLGANLSCDAEVLAQFAVLGTVYARVVEGISNPSVGLLNVGSEEMKGHEEVRAAAAILSQVEFPGAYHGFIEGDDIGLGTVDVVVTDGFTGNVALKTAEGIGKLTSQFLRDAFKSSPLAMLGYALAAGGIKRLKERVDPRHYNGGMFLGLDGICVKSHGGSDELGTKHAILVAADLVRGGFNKRVAYEIEQLMSQESFFSVSSGS
jgi:glycerol-3-phosphate acyltransferase PlsX